jgi:hypothetical protein
MNISAQAAITNAKPAALAAVPELNRKIDDDCLLLLGCAFSGRRKTRANVHIQDIAVDSEMRNVS